MQWANVRKANQEKKDLSQSPIWPLIGSSIRPVKVSIHQVNCSATVMRAAFPYKGKPGRWKASAISHHHVRSSGPLSAVMSGCVSRRCSCFLYILECLIFVLFLMEIIGLLIMAFHFFFFSFFLFCFVFVSLFFVDRQCG